MKRTVSKIIFNLMLVGGILFSSNIPVLAAANPAPSLVKDVNKNNYSSFTFTNGYGAIAGGNFSLTNGATCTFDISTPIKNVTTETDLKDFIKNNKSLFTDKQYSQIISLPAYTQDGEGSKLLCQLLNIVFDYDSYENVNNKKGNALNSQQQQLLNELHNLKASNYVLKGTQEAIGTSYIPTKPYCWIQLSKLAFSDGKTLKVTNTNTTIGDGNCSTTKVQSSENNSNLQLIKN